MTKFLPIQQYLTNANQLVLGCMGLGGTWNQNPIEKADFKLAHETVEQALAVGINVFDHADIYTMGKAESVFGHVMATNKSVRSDIYIQSKCGIRFEDENGPGRYDFSKSWIISSVEGSLKRLKTDYLDLLILHRPDPLMDLHEVAQAFTELKNHGKVHHFGVSNMHGYQVDFLQSALPFPIVCNQLEMSLRNPHWVNETLTAGMQSEQHFSPGTVTYCQKNGVQLQAWGALGQGVLTGKPMVHNTPKNIVQTANLVKQLSQDLGVSTEAVVLAWLTKHPANIQPVIGTTNINRIVSCSEFKNITLTREQWYRLYVAIRGEALP